MDSQPKIVDLTLSDKDEESCDKIEFLSLQERLLLIEKQKQKFTVTESVSTSPIKKRWHSSSDDEDLILNIKNNEIKLQNDDNSSNELPDIVDFLKVHSCVKFSGSDNEFKKDLTKNPKKTKKVRSKQDVDPEKENAKLEKIKLREQKKQEKELAKALKASEKEMQKSKKPDELLKGMKILIDQSIIFENESEDIFCALDESNLKYNIEENSVNMSITWCRTIVDITVENNQVVKMEKEQMENVLVLLITKENFTKMVHAFLQKSKGNVANEITLLDHITNIKSVFPHMDITCVVVGLDKYLRSIKDNEKCNTDLKKMARQVSKIAIEEATIEVQIQTYVNFNFLNTMRELGELLARFTKAIAEAPQRKEKHAQKCLAFSWYADADSSCPVKIGKDGSGFMKLWQQQIQQFNNVGPEVAEAIASKYPSPQILMQAYKKCSSSKQAELLLQDIVVRRNYGPLGTQRRIGPELSYKIHLFFSSRNGDQILQR
ncbi:crossover junction endonuclease EME1 [Trichonephila clavata]|uniref:Crossover junction endonuclease EME1 n=1 Tax=Trichonephila clavata TaxID=2740835 RepID=A0A8X6FVS2_TRICU|nr:crossover junction endonuclease EME1 [Trichonephila clavata]